MTKNNGLFVVFVFVGILESLFFGFMIGGWSSYVYVLTDHGFYSEICEANNFLTSNETNSLVKSITQNSTSTKSASIMADNMTMSQHSCTEQQEKLHFLFSISMVPFYLLVALWGPIIYKFGLIISKLLSMISVCLGCLILGFATPDAPVVIVPGIIILGVGGLGIAVINMRISILLTIGSGVYIALLNGAFDSSVISFWIVKIVHDNGIHYRYPFIGLVVVHLIVGGVSLLLHRAFDTRQNESNEDLSIDVNNITQDKGIELKTYIDTNEGIEEGDKVKEHVSLKDSLCSLKTLSHLILMSILMLNFLYYIGTINSRLQNVVPDQVSYYINVWSYINAGGIVTALIPGFLVEWQIKLFKDRRDITLRSFMPNVIPLFSLCVLGMVLNILSFFASERLFYVEFVVYTLFRSFLFSTAMAFIVSAFPLKHANVILPLGLSTGGVFSFLQYALFKWYNQSESSQKQVQIFMTAFVACSLVHPFVVYITAKGVFKKSIPVKQNMKCML